MKVALLGPYGLKGSVKSIVYNISKYLYYYNKNIEITVITHNSIPEKIFNELSNINFIKIKKK